jgi:hypothetical protein
MEGVQKVRELEQLVVADAKNANLLLIIKKQLQNEEISKEERTALHSLRRIFVNIFENGRLEASFVSLNSNQLSQSADSGKLQEHKRWLIEQFYSYQRILRQLIACNDPSLQAPAVRTMLEVRYFGKYSTRQSLINDLMGKTNLRVLNYYVFT